MPRTLVIDDDPDLQARIRAHFGSDADSSFVFAANDDEALAIMAADDGDIDIAVVALDSDDISGLGVFKKLKGKRMRVPRIALVSGHDITTIRKAMNDGAADFLTKPIEIEDFKVTLDKVFADCEERRRAWRNEAELSAIKREMKLAGDLQQRILPEQFEGRDELEMFARTTPARTMGGDFYDFFDLEDGRIGIVVADVAGKGVPAAFYMAMVRTLIRSHAADASPAQCLETVNLRLTETNLTGMFVTLFYSILDPHTWQMTFANGGHPPPYLVRAGGTLEALDGGAGVVLGFEHNVPYSESQVTLEPGDSVFIYTDGVTEAFDVERNQLSDERLMACLLENRSENAHALADNVFAFVNMFAGEAEQSDDMTSLVIKRFSPP